MPEDVWPGGAAAVWRNLGVGGMAAMSSAARPSLGRVGVLRDLLRDQRSGRVVFVSHCLLNENTRYLGGAYRAGAVQEVIDPYLRNGTGICQMPCPEQVAWGGVLKLRLLGLYARPRLRPFLRLLVPALTAYTGLRYRLLAHQIGGQIADYQRSGYEVVGVIGVDPSPSCGVSATLDTRSALDALTCCPLSRLDRRFMNDTVIAGSVRPGRGRFVAAISDALARDGRQVPLLRHDLRSEAAGSPKPPGVVVAGVAGTARGSVRPTRTAGT